MRGGQSTLARSTTKEKGAKHLIGAVLEAAAGVGVGTAPPACVTCCVAMIPRTTHATVPICTAMAAADSFDCGTGLARVGVGVDETKERMSGR